MFYSLDSIQIPSYTVAPHWTPKEEGTASTTILDAAKEKENNRLESSLPKAFLESQSDSLIVHKYNQSFSSMVLLRRFPKYMLAVAPAV
jgi:hypothetical protein